ncbi:MAG: TonB-dependent receptor [Saprospiraceae bacterium]|nr:TonB-dependent receptor [Saprospiraceae bacterium]
MRISLTLLISLLFTICHAQNAGLLGKIIDANTKEALTGATVKAGSTGSSADLDGNFKLSLPPGTYEVNISMVGYESQTLTVRLADGEQRTLTIELSDGANLLQTATVTAGKFEKPLGEVTVSLDVIKPKLVESTNATSIDEVLIKSPGLNIIDGQASIRGGAGFSYGAGTRVLVLLDDIPALQPDAGLPNWDDFPVENIAQMEILKGAASALYGSSAMNGIINIRTGFAKDKPETNFAVFSKVWGNPKDISKKWWGTDTSSIVLPFETGVSFLHRRKEGKRDVVVGAYGFFRDSYNRDTYSRYARVTPNLRYRVNDRLTIGLNTNINIGRSGSFFIWGNDTTHAYQAGAGSVSFTKGRLRFTIDPSLQYFDKSGNRHKILSRYFYIHNNNSGNQSNDSRLYYGEYQFQRQLDRIGLVTTAGVVGIYNTVDAEIYSNANFTSRNLAGYVQFDYKMFSRLNLSAGLRYEHNVQKSPDTVWVDRSRNDFGIIPNGEVVEGKPVYRFGANYRAGQATYFRASWGQGYRYPTLAEKFVNTEFGAGSSVVPNPALVSETGWTAEIGLKQGFKIGEWRGFVDATYFVSEYQQMMEFVLDTIFFSFGPNGIQGASRFRSENSGDTHVEGYEISVIGSSDLWGGTFSLLTGFTSIDPKYKVFDKDNPNLNYGSSDTNNVLKYRFNQTFKLDAEYSKKKLSVGLSVQYYSFMKAIDELFEGRVKGVDLGPLAPSEFVAVRNFRARNNNGSTVVDLRASYAVNDHLKLSALCGNLFNEEYAIRPALLDAPRNYTLRLDYKL